MGRQGRGIPGDFLHVSGGVTVVLRLIRTVILWESNRIPSDTNQPEAGYTAEGPPGRAWRFTVSWKSIVQWFLDMSLSIKVNFSTEPTPVGVMFLRVITWCCTCTIKYSSHCFSSIGESGKLRECQCSVLGIFRLLKTKRNNCAHQCDLDSTGSFRDNRF